VADLATVLIARLAPGPRAAPLQSPTLSRIVLATSALVGVLLLVPALGDLDARRKLANRSGEVGAAVWLAQALPVIQQGAVVVSWWSTSTPLWYAQKVEGLRPDIDVIDDRTMLDRHLGRAPDVIKRTLAEGRPIYAIRIDYNGDLAELTNQFDMTLVASGGSTGLWRVNGYGVTAQ
jgi:hypothetical protein